jgi:hypothetical protein
MDQGLFIIVESKDIPDKDKRIEDILNKRKQITLHNKEDYTSLITKK